jgi:uncharacterized protein (DUF58 family)
VTDSSLHTYVDWTKLSALNLLARHVAEGVHAGAHRSRNRGSGVEFAGHRDYVPGDDLRFLDRRGLMRHGKLLVRQFETETERPVHLLVDATPSMNFQSKLAPVTKFFYAAAVAAALAHLATKAGDPVGLGLFGVDDTLLRPRGGRTALERLIDALESVRFPKVRSPEASFSGLDGALFMLEKQATRGAVIVLLSDLLDVPPELLTRFSGLAAGRRTLLAVQVLDPLEATFPFDGAVRLQGNESGAEVETDGTLSRDGYMAALTDVRARWGDRLTRQGGSLVTAATNQDPTDLLRTITSAASKGRP